MSDHDKDIHVTAVVGADGSVRLDKLPFHAGQAVDITIHPLSVEPGTPPSHRYQPVAKVHPWPLATRKTALFTGAALPAPHP
jgi:hypothetical protein